MRTKAIIAIFILISLSACAPASKPEPTIPATATQLPPTATIEPTPDISDTPTPAPAADTPEPPTATPKPTPVPPTPTPVSQQELTQVESNMPNLTTKEGVAVNYDKRAVVVDDQLKTEFPGFFAGRNLDGKTVGLYLENGEIRALMLPDAMRIYDAEGNKPLSSPIGLTAEALRKLGYSKPDLHDFVLPVDITTAAGEGEDAKLWLQQTKLKFEPEFIQNSSVVLRIPKGSQIVVGVESSPNSATNVYIAPQSWGTFIVIQERFQSIFDKDGLNMTINLTDDISSTDRVLSLGEKIESFGWSRHASRPNLSSAGFRPGLSLPENNMEIAFRSSFVGKVTTRPELSDISSQDGAFFFTLTNPN